MKAFLLAGGLGTRLMPLTRALPKCMVPIGGEPLLAIWLAHLAREGVRDVLVNVSQHVEQVEQFLESRRWDLTVQVEREHQPRGNAGTVSARRDFVAGEESFYVLYADNLTDVSLAPLAALHRRHPAPITIGLFRAAVPKSAGIVQLTETGLVCAFEEKPEQPVGNLANAGIYLARQSIFDCIPSGPTVVDFGHDVLPQLVGCMHACVLDGFFMDVGTPETLMQATNGWQQRSRQAATL